VRLASEIAALVALAALAVLACLAVVAVTEHVDEVRARLSAVEEVAGYASVAIDEHESWAADEAEAYRLRCEWSMVPSAMQREVTDAILLRPRDGRPVAVNLEIQE